MKCPYCSEEMAKGYIDQPDFRFPLEWYPVKHGTGIFTSKKRNIKLTSIFAGGSIIAYHCAGCKKFVIEYP